MAVVRCSKGHYYDDTKFSQCPHCGVLPAAEPEKPDKPKRFNFFRKDKDKETTHQQPQAPVIPAVPGGSATSLNYDDRTIGLSQMPGAGTEDDDRTIAFGQSSGGSYMEDDNQTIAFGQSSGGSYMEDDNRTIAFGQSSAGSVGEDDNRTIAFPHTPPASVDEDDNRTIAFPHTPSASIDEDDNRTIAFPHTPSASIDEDDNRTIAFSHSSRLTDTDSKVLPEAKAETVIEGSSVTSAASAPSKSESTKPEPAKPGLSNGMTGSGIKPQPSVEEASPLSPAQYVAGWLVCVKGEGKGRDYRLYRGFNRMGSQENMDIPLPKELNETVCAVVYDDRSNHFYLVWQSGEPVYLNEAAVQKSAEIHTGDRIQAGEAEFEFIAFCREGRVWEA